MRTRHRALMTIVLDGFGGGDAKACSKLMRRARTDTFGSASFGNTIQVASKTSALAAKRRDMYWSAPRPYPGMRNAQWIEAQKPGYVRSSESGTRRLPWPGA